MFLFQAFNDLQEEARPHPDNLVRLLCAMQSNLLFWIRHQLSSGKELKEEQWTKIKEIMHNLLKQCEYNGPVNVAIDFSPLFVF